MDDASPKSNDVSAFLQGHPDQVESIAVAVRLAIRSFQFRDRELERDLAQETLSRVLAGLSAGQFRGDSSLRTYASNVARYTCLEHLRKRRWDSQPDGDQLVSTSRWSAPEASFLADEEHERNLLAFAALPADCQELLCMVSLEGATYREVAARLGVSEGALKSRVHRCRACLRESSSDAQHPRRGSSRT